MKVIMLKDKKTVEVNDGYGLRLIEQGMAILAPKKAEPPKQEAPKAREEKTGKAKK
jgi:ribosomal protein L9